jgi:hypothetical protein
MLSGVSAASLQVARLMRKIKMSFNIPFTEKSAFEKHYTNSTSSGSLFFIPGSADEVLLGIPWSSSCVSALSIAA